MTSVLPGKFERRGRDTRIVGRGRGSGTSAWSVCVACTVVMMPRSIGTVAVKTRIAALNPVNAFRPLALTHAPRLKKWAPGPERTLAQDLPWPNAETKSNQAG